MKHATKEQLDCIASVLAKNDKNLYTKTDVNRAIVDELSRRVGWSCSLGYIANLRNGVQLDKASYALRDKIGRLYNILCKIKKPKRVVLPDTECIRTLKVYGTEHELREAQRLSTRERMEVLLYKSP